MFDLYMDLPPWLRTTLAALMLLIGLALAVGGWMNRPQYATTRTRSGTEITYLESGMAGAQALYRIGFVTSGVGMVLFCFCGKSSSERAGYNF